MTAASRARFATPTGPIVGLVFWFASFTPTLVPRGWIVQGVTGGVCLAIGYGLGTAGGRAVRLAARRPLERPVRRPVPSFAIGLVAMVVATAGALAWAAWQNEARDIVGMPHLEWWEGLPMVLLSLVVAIGLRRAGRAFAAWTGRAARAARHAWDPRRAMAIGAVGVALIGPVGGGILISPLVAALNGIYWALDQGTNPGIERPTLATVSGSAPSLVAWRTMGLWGRDFAAGVTSRDELLAYHGPAAAIRDPVRVFVGMGTAASIEERAALAVRELERAGGFGREVLAVWVPAGSGWMDPNATRALELLHAGDTAIVAMQYSVLPSFFSLVVDSSQAERAGEALFDAVHARWSSLPADGRPRLIVFGASLGAVGAERPFVGRDAAESTANFSERADGALIVGSLGWNPILRQLTEARQPGSVVWEPVYDDGRIVRFMTAAHPPRADAPHQPARVIYLQHPTDPVAYLSLDQLWSPPAWMAEPRGDGVPPHTGWFPIVSTVQALADISFAASLPSGFGHDYRVDYADAFARVVPPDGWVADDTARLEAHLDRETHTAADVP